MKITYIKNEKEISIEISKNIYPNGRLAIYANEQELSVNLDNFMLANEIVLNTKEINQELIQKLYEEERIVKTRRNAITGNYIYPIVKLSDAFLRELESN